MCVKGFFVYDNALDSAMTILCAVLGTNLSLEKLNLSRTGIRDAIAIALANVLVSNNTLIELILTGSNDINHQ